ncbi:hypothetical protein HYY73_04550 [Candidatus Woesearchaeota archaeon]|nr:hypothetical protein [Candidatus Woesearchaeota archaeon]
MLNLAAAEQFGRGELSHYSELPWKDLSQKLGGLGYRQVTEVPIPHFGSLHVLSRHNYSPLFFLPRNEPVQMSSAAMVRAYGVDEKVDHLLMTRPGIKLSVEELAHDADVIGRYFTDMTRSFETRLLKNPLAILGIYAGLGLAAGVGGGELIYQQFPTTSTDGRYVLDVALGFFSSLAVPAARILFESKVRYPLLRMRAASQMNVSSYLFGSEAVNSVDNESRALRFEIAASLVYFELEKSGVAIDKETFYSAFAVIGKLGLDKAERITPVTKVPLERIVQIARAHPGLLPTHASAR